MTAHRDGGFVLHIPPLLGLFRLYFTVLLLQEFEFFRACLSPCVGSVYSKEAAGWLGNFQQHSNMLVITRLGRKTLVTEV